jgi:hypothetical protein
MLCSECERLRIALLRASAEHLTTKKEYQRLITQSFAMGQFPGRELDEAVQRVQEADKLRSTLYAQFDAHMATHPRS